MICIYKNIIVGVNVGIECNIKDKQFFWGRVLR